MKTKSSQRRHYKLGFILAGIIFIMVGLSFASVPLYRLFCQVTGFGGTPRIEKNGDVVNNNKSSKTIKIRFDASVQPDLPWEFRPENTEVTVELDTVTTIYFIAKNKSKHPIVGQAVFNITPHKAATYFVKIDCFCFTEQALEPGEQKKLPVNFYVDSSIFSNKSEAQEVETITLSYTFYRLEDAPDMENMENNSDNMENN